MQKAQLAAALAATLGFALHGTAFAADNSFGVTEKTTKNQKNVIAKGDTASEKGSEAACKGKDGSCKGKDGSCKGKDAAASTGKKHSKKTTKETKTTDTKTTDSTSTK